MSVVDRILELCRSLQYQSAKEKDIQESLEEVLRAAFDTVDREARLSSTDIVDFLIEDVGIEVKVDGSPMFVSRQLQRYAAHDRVKSLVLVTTRGKHITIPRTLLGKRIAVAWLNPF